MSKRNRPTTAAQATHRRRRHEYRTAYNSPEAKAARAASGQGAAAAAKPAAKPAMARPVKSPATPAAKPPTQS